MDSLELIVDEKYDRSLFATRNFLVGSVVLNELPLVTFQGIEDLAHCYMSMDMDTKAKLLEFQHYSSSEHAKHALFQVTLDDTLDAVHASVASFNASYRPIVTLIAPSEDSTYVVLDAEDLYALATVCLVNSHQFHPNSQPLIESVSNSQPHNNNYSSSGNDRSDNPNTLRPITSPYPLTNSICDVDESSCTSTSALFSFGSKVTHSCAPNCAYSSIFLQNSLTYFCVTPIAAGDMLTFSYVDYMCTKDRRHKLLTSKDFFCMCAKCSGPDFAYGVKCESVGCSGVKLGTCIQSNFDTDWKCLDCGNSDICEDMESNIEYMEERFDSLKSMYTVDGMRYHSNIHADMLEALIQECVAMFCHTHYLVTAILLEMSQLLNCGADSLTVSGALSIGEISRLRQRAAAAGLRAVKTIECVESSCVLGDICKTEHAPSHHCIGHVLEASLQLLSGSNTGASTGVSGSHSMTNHEVLPSLISKYVPFLEGMYHPSHCDVSKIRIALGRV